MAKRKNTNGATRCTCSSCRIECPSTIPGTTHRRCSGKTDVGPLPKRSPKASNRGEWTVAK